MIQLRDYQLKMKQDITDAWKSHQNICGVLPTGAGKTVLFGSILAEYPGWSIVAAHRQELVGQISNALARIGLRHSILAPDQTIKWIVKMHIQKFGRPYYDPLAKCVVAGVDTLTARISKPWVKNLLKKISLWVMDECHHILQSNKWGRVVKQLDHAKGLGVTAIPERADGKGIGRTALGVFDTIVCGPNMRDLINQGYLTDYRIICPPSNINKETLKLSRLTGDYTRQSIVKTVRKSTIMGDIVKHYQTWAYGKQGVTFVPDVSTAHEVAEAFRTADISAEAVHAGTPGPERQRIIDKFENGRILQLVNVDLFGEGFDLPALEVVSMARPTQSFGLYSQQFGRALRPLPGKTKAIIIDHAGNTLNPFFKGPPDARREWSLAGRPRKQQEATVKIKVCANCLSAYRVFLKSCPYCGFTPKPAIRSAPKYVDGDLIELDPQVLARLRGEADSLMSSESYAAFTLQRAGAPAAAVLGARKNHNERRIAQEELRKTIAMWAALQRQKGYPDSESYRKFYYTWGIDVMNAQILGKRQAIELNKRIKKSDITLGEQSLDSQ